LVFRQRIGPTCQHDAGVGGSRIDPGHRQPADVVHLCRPSIEGQPHHVITVTDDDLVCDGSCRDEPNASHAVVLRIERRQLLAGHDVGFRRAQPGEQSRRTYVVDPRYRCQRSADLLGDQRQVDQRRAVSPDGVGQRHRRRTHAA
jgi:hypothetical protein